MALEIKDGHIICGDDELHPFITHPDHAQILAHHMMASIEQITYMRHDLTGSLHKGSGW